MNKNMLAILNLYVNFLKTLQALSTYQQDGNKITNFSILFAKEFSIKFFVSRVLELEFILRG